MVDKTQTTEIGWFEAQVFLAEEAAKGWPDWMFESTANGFKAVKVNGDIEKVKVTKKVCRNCNGTGSVST